MYSLLCRVMSWFSCAGREREDSVIVLVRVAGGWWGCLLDRHIVLFR